MPRFTELPLADDLEGDEIIAIVQDGASKKLPINLISGSIESDSVGGIEISFGEPPTLPPDNGLIYLWFNLPS